MHLLNACTSRVATCSQASSSHDICGGERYVLICVVHYFPTLTLLGRYLNYDYNLWAAVATRPVLISYDYICCCGAGGIDGIVGVAPSRRCCAAMEGHAGP